MALSSSLALHIRLSYTRQGLRVDKATSPSVLALHIFPTNTRQGLRVDTSSSGLASHVRPSNTRQGLRVVTRWGYGLCLGQGFSLVEGGMSSPSLVA